MHFGAKLLETAVVPSVGCRRDYPFVTHEGLTHCRFPPVSADTVPGLLEDGNATFSHETIMKPIRRARWGVTACSSVHPPPNEGAVHALV